MENIFDAHAHYDDEWFNEDREELLLNLHKNGVKYIVNASIDEKSMEFSNDLVNKYDFIFATAGYHPENLENLRNDYLDVVKKYISKDKFVAIGEIGLDYHWDIEKNLQQRVFEEQVKFAKEIDMPVVVHDREAHQDVFDILKKYRPKGIVHCFSGSVEMLKEVLKLGMSISLGGTVTYKNARVPLEVAKEVPLDKLLLETDAPYLSPVPNRGKRNDSGNISFTAEKIAEIKGVSVEKLLKETCSNAQKIYEIK